MLNHLLCTLGPTAVIPQYYGVHWGVYPANIIQQQGPGGQPRRPNSPSQTNEVTNQSNGNLAAAAAAAGNMQGPLSQYQVCTNRQLDNCTFFGKNEMYVSYPSILY